MRNLEYLFNIILKEAPLSTYLKSAGSKLISPSSYIRGAGKVLKGAGQATGVFKTSTDYLSRGLTKAGVAAAGVGTPKRFKDNQQTVKTKQQEIKSADSGSINYSKAKTSFVINNRQITTKYYNSTQSGYPIYRIQGIPWAKSIIIEPKNKNKASAYFYKDKTPNIKKPPAMIRPATLDYSPVQNTLIVTTK